MGVRGDGFLREPSAVDLLRGICPRLVERVSVNE